MHCVTWNSHASRFYFCVKGQYFSPQWQSEIFILTNRMCWSNQQWLSCVFSGVLATRYVSKNKWKLWSLRGSLHICGAGNLKQLEPPDWCLGWALQHDGFWLEGLIGDGHFREVVNKWRWVPTTVRCWIKAQEQRNQEHFECASGQRMKRDLIGWEDSELMTIPMSLVHPEQLVAPLLCPVWLKWWGLFLAFISHLSLDCKSDPMQTGKRSFF